MEKPPVPQRSSSSDSIAISPSSDVPKLNRLYGSKDYWEGRFLEEESYEWLLSYNQLASQLKPFLEKPDCRILVVGCGNAPFSADMYDAGYKHIVNLDYSQTVIDTMKARHVTSRPEMEWIVMDMTNMPFLADASFDVCIDKAATDALIADEVDVWSPSSSAIASARSMCTHVSRILRPGGYFIQISLVQPHFRKKYLLGWHGSESADLSDDAYSKEFGWTFECEKAADDSSVGCFGYFLYKMTKTSR
jgi:EEF1A lysine methyltransferase 4